LVYLYSTIKMIHGPISIRYCPVVYQNTVSPDKCISRSSQETRDNLHIQKTEFENLFLQNLHMKGSFLTKKNMYCLVQSA